ncbi:MAG: YczE/YyaS/YitT family protein [Rhodoluna sp.]
MKNSLVNLGIKPIGRLLLGLYLVGLGLAMMIHTGLGVPPWDVLSQGLQVQTGWSFGTCAVVISGIVLLMWIPIKQQPGIGTVINAILIGPFADLSKPLMPELSGWFANLVWMIIGLIAVAIGSGLYISANLGAGPRDGLMVGLTRVSGWPFWVIRTIGESVVLITGWLLGGTVGIGTALFAISIGTLMQMTMKWFGFDPKSDSNGVKTPK